MGFMLVVEVDSTKFIYCMENSTFGVEFSIQSTFLNPLQLY
jgi:hypothetical protein